MDKPEQRLNELGLRLPPEPKVPPGISIPFKWVRIRGSRAFISGHGALSPDGVPQGPFGAVPSEVTLEQAQESARSALLSMLGSLKREVGVWNVLSPGSQLEDLSMPTPVIPPRRWWSIPCPSSS